MSGSEETKNRIIEITTALLTEHGGDVRKITSRSIAKRAGIGLGTINYFFGSKENLIAECVQRIIRRLLAGFAPDVSDVSAADGMSDEARLSSWAVRTFDYLFENREIVRISILSDLQNYSAGSNSVYTQRGFAFAVRDSRYDRAKKLLMFVLVSAMQTAFLAKEQSREILGYDLESKTERDRFVLDTVSMLLHGADGKKGENV